MRLKIGKTKLLCFADGRYTMERYLILLSKKQVIDLKTTTLC